jgi:hypothetical protein
MFIYAHTHSHSGKIARQWCRKAFLKNDLQPLYTRSSTADAADSGIYTEPADATTAAAADASSTAAATGDSSATKHSTASVQQQPPLQVIVSIHSHCHCRYPILCQQLRCLLSVLNDSCACSELLAVRHGTRTYELYTP